MSAASANVGSLHYLSEPCDPLDPLQVFAAAGEAPRFYWEQPTARCFRVGVGCAASLIVEGPARFKQADAGARTLLDRVAWEGTGPRVGHLVGGFAFAPGTGTAEPWQGFPDGELRLPELVYARDGDRYTRDANRESRWSTLEPRPLTLGQPVRGAAEFAHEEPARYFERVRRALGEIHAGRLQKVVVTRAAYVTSRHPIDAVSWLVALRERFPGCTLFAIGEGDKVFLGATPERLVRVRGDEVETAAIAGTAPRGASRATAARTATSTQSSSAIWQRCCRSVAKTSRWTPNRRSLRPARCSTCGPSCGRGAARMHRSRCWNSCRSCTRRQQSVAHRAPRHSVG
jgi:isochorismate synthase EntC